MYDEYERALGVNRSRSPLVWFLVVFGLFAVVGVTAATFAIRRGIDAVQERLAALDLDGAASRVVDRLDDHTSLLRAEPATGLEYLRTLDPGEPSESLLEGLLPSNLSPFRAEAEKARGPERQVVGNGALDQERDRSDDRRTFSFRAGDEELRIDFDRGEDGGSLVIGAGDETVRVDLVRTDDGGFLTIDDGEDAARVDLQKTTDGGRLTIDAPDGQLRFDLTERDGGGSMVVRTDGDEILRLGLGQDARAMPGWVPRRSAMPSDPDPVYSLTSDDGFLGAVTWGESDSAEEVVEHYAAQLVDAGFRLESEAQDRGGRVERNALWARDQDSDRFVFVVAEYDGSTTEVLLGFGEGR